MCGIVSNVGRSLGEGGWESGTSAGTMDGNRYGSEAVLVEAGGILPVPLRYLYCYEGWTETYFFG